jgi:molybdopterin-containing oxidoreductase family iron-sulfur binding subunit
MSEKLWRQFLNEDKKGDSVDLSARSPIAGVSRRTFLEVLGYSGLALTLSGCRAPEQKIVPYLHQPVELTPGVASWYATTCGACSAGCGVLAKVRDGRPIKLEGNPDHPFSQGGLCAIAQASLFGLYDPDRLRQPQIAATAATWDQIDKEIGEKLEALKQRNGRIRVLTSSSMGPTTRETIQRFLAPFKDGKHITYEPVSNNAIRLAHLKSHGTAAIPSYHFDKAKLVVSLGADFLGTWIAPVQFTREYAKARSLQAGENQMLRHVQIESRVSLTGSNADRRITASPAQQTAALLQLAQLISAGTPLKSLEQTKPVSAGGLQEAIAKLAEELLLLPGHTLVISGANDPESQLLVNYVNHSLGNYGSTLDLQHPFGVDTSFDGEIVELIQQMDAGEIDALIHFGVNPAYDYFDTQKFTSALKRVPLKISANAYFDETSSLADYTCPSHHWLESWDDAQPIVGTLSLSQPSIAPLFRTRAFPDSLLRWSNDQRSFYEVLRSTWRDKVFPRQQKQKDFEEFWDSTLQQGTVSLEPAETTAPAYQADGLDQVISNLQNRAASSNDELHLELYQKTTIRDGRYANNPWLQELPDPITKVTWENYASISSGYAGRLGLSEGHVVRLHQRGTTVELPVHIQPGQSEAVIAVALGYGRSKAGKAGSNVGTSAFPFVGYVDGTFRYEGTGVTVEKTARKVEFAKTQMKDSMEGRPLVRELPLAEYLAGQGEHEREHESLYSSHDYPEHKWGIAVDLSACVGCSACVVSCQAENNIPVVGKDEVRRRREMHWLRIDRYFELEVEELKTFYQPVMCAQCDNASCESVCPVLATVHSSEGLNMQVYNRCVGTRYCENNCPYKVRRFNWFEYDRGDPIANLALNPDVTVRSRGVMEKCTFCVQRIEEIKIKARNEGRRLNDLEIQPACQQSCPANAIVFGDLTDVQSRVSTLKRSGRNYTLLDELNLRPAVSYLAKVRNAGES